jgi:hypothetical protein
MEAGERDDVTGRAGMAVVVEAAKALGVDKVVREHLEIRERESGFSEAEKIEALLLLQSAGGECVEDIRILSADKGLERILERTLPSPDALHRFLGAFHDEKKFKDRPKEGAFIAEESERLQQLATVNTALVRRAGKQTKATVDLDATIIEAHKRDALWHYKGGRGYQPTLALWAEEDLVLADEFRDGNVPAGMQPLRVAQRAFCALPGTVNEFYFRGDSACYEEGLLKWLCNSERAGGPCATIRFSISADMTEPLKEVCRATSTWTALEDRPREIVEWAEVEFTPGDWPKDAKPLRYVALRFTAKQLELFEAERRIKHLAIVSNRGEEDLAAPDLIRWHWQKAGTVELTHDVMKNELGAGSLPSGLFGANAAWYRLCGLTYNVLSFLRRHALPERLHSCRPKRLRFEMFHLAARITEPAGVLTAKMNAPADLVQEIIQARQKLLAFYEQRAET